MLSVPRYRMTLTGVDMTKKHVSKTLIVAASDPHQSIVASSEKFKLVVGSVVVENLHEDVLDCVYVCRSEDRNAITRIRNKVESLGAVALLAFQTPMMKTPFPVFLVDVKSTLDFFQYVSDVTVSFELLCSPMAEGDAAVKGNEFFPSENWFPPEDGGNVSLDSKYPSGVSSDTFEPTQSETFLEAARVDAPSNQSDSNASEGISWNPLKLFRKAGKAVSGVVSDVANATYEMVTPNKEKIFKMNFNNNGEGNNNCYGHALEMIHKVCVADQVTAAMDYLKLQQRKEMMIGHVVAVALICNKSRDRELGNGLLECIARSKLTKVETEFLKQRKRKDAKEWFILPQSVLYEFLIESVGSWDYTSIQRDSIYDDLTWKVVVLLDICGLTRKFFDNAVWKPLRQTIKPEIFARYQVEVQKILGNNRGFTLLLCFQRDFFDFKRLCESQGIGMTRKLESVTFFALQQVINDHLSTGLSSFAPIWASFLEMMKIVQFSVGMPEEKLIVLFLDKISLKQENHIEALSEVVAANGADYHCKSIVETNIKGVLSKYFQSSEVTTRSIICMVSLPLSSYLSQSEVFDASSKLLQVHHPSLFEQNVILIDILCKNQVGENAGWEKAVAGRVHDWINSVIQCQGSSFSTLCKLLQLAVDKTDLFSVSKNIGGPQRIAEIVTVHFMEVILSSPHVLHEIPIPDDTVPSEFFNSVLASIQRKLQNRLKAVSKARSFFVEVVEETRAVQNSPAASIAINVLQFSLKNWKPPTLLDIFPEEKDVIAFLFTVNTPFVGDDGFNSALDNCRKYIISLLITWKRLFDSETLTLQDFQQANVLCETRIWDPLDACSDLSFPSATILHGKIDEIASLKTSIGKCLTVTVAEQSFPLLDLLTEYHC
jgi:hypothetical protein